MKRNINVKNVKQELSSKTYTINHQDKKVEAIFDLNDLTIKHKKDDINFEGVANYTFDTEYGGGPVSIKIDFKVIDGVVNIDFNNIAYDKLLNWKEIESESNINYAYIDDEDDDEEEVYDDSDTDDELEDEDYEIFDEEDDN